MSFARFLLALVFASGACTVAAQELYRWTDERGRTHVTDIPPPPGARNVRKLNPGAVPDGAASKPAADVPYVLDVAMKQYPVTLYTSPNCTEPCGMARELLNKRGVPFKEVQVWEEESNEELKKLSGKTQVPTVKVGSTVYSGFEAAAYDSLLDSAGYPKAGVLPARSQGDPGMPEGYVPPAERPKAEPAKPEAEAPPPAPTGPYAPR